MANLGEEIKKTVQDALNSQDFKQLNKDIKDTVKAAMDEVKQAFSMNQQTKFNQSKKTADTDAQSQETQRQQSSTVENGTGQERSAYSGQNADQNANKNRKQYERQWENGAGRDENGRTYKIIRNAAGRFVRVFDEPKYEPKRQPPVIKRTRKPKGKGMGFCLSAAGILGLFSGLGVLYPIIVEGVTSVGLIAGTFLIPLGLISTLMGNLKLRKVGIYRSYIKLVQGKEYYSIEEMAKCLGRKEKNVIRDLKKMIDLRYFPEGHIDDEKTCFMLTDKTYQVYQDMKSYKEEIKKEEQEAAEKGLSETTRQVIEEGREYVRQIRQSNEVITDAVFSGKLIRLETVISEIFDFIEEHPQKEWDIHRFMEYYLPTALKLVQAYGDFNSQVVEGENITMAKREIEDTLETINTAFEKLLDSMFEETAMDVSTDISALQAMLAQDGLIGNDFNLNAAGASRNGGNNGR